jgi:hypothetical protein
MNAKEHFVKSCLLSLKQDFPETALEGDILHYLDGSFYVYWIGKWVALEEALTTIFEV